MLGLEAQCEGRTWGRLSNAGPGYGGVAGKEIGRVKRKHVGGVLSRTSAKRI